MTITIHPEIEQRLRLRAEAEGLTVEAYIERLVRADQEAEDEIGALAYEGLHSGEPIQPDVKYWEEKHRRLEERLGQTASR